MPLLKWLPQSERSHPTYALLSVLIVYPSFNTEFEWHPLLGAFATIPRRTFLLLHVYSHSTLYVPYHMMLWIFSIDVDVG